MSSSISLSSSLSQNLTSLKSTEALMSETSYKLTTGRKVNSALDDPVAFFTSEAHLDRATDLQELKDNMSEAIQTITAADEAITSIKDLISNAKSILKSALTADDETDMTSYISEYNEILGQIDELAEDASYGDTNLLAADGLEVTFNEDGSSSITVDGFFCSTKRNLGNVTASAVTGLNLTAADDTAAAVATADAADGATAVTGSKTDNTGTYGNGNTAYLCSEDATGNFLVNTNNINLLIDELDDAKSTLRTNSKSLSNQLSVIEARNDFTSNLISVLESGSANLVNADTTKEGVNLTTLQTQQSLAINSLSIANSASQAVLSLFS